MEGPGSSRSRLVRFGVFELDTHSGELRKAGLRVPLQDQPLKLLERLLDHPGEIITRDELRRCLWPDDTFVDFEQGVNAAVKRLREALADSAEAPRFIQTLPRRGYRFIAPVARDDGNGADSADAIDGGQPPLVRPAPGHTERRGAGWRRAVAIVGIAGALIAAAVWIILIRPSRSGAASSPPASPPAPRVMPLTRLSGSEDQPAFSPDGNQVAFTWDGDASDNADIYVTLVGSSDVRRLTTDPGRDFAPQWSPDGRQIAYVRAASDTSQRIRVMSALGGSDREVSDFAVWAPIAWTPDGRFIAAGRAGNASVVGQPHAIHLIPLGAGSPRPLTRPEGDGTDWSPAFAPDGRRLAYASCGDLAYRSVCHVQVVDLDAAFAPVGAPRRLTRDSVWSISGLAWTRDGKGVVYSARQGSLVQLWRADAAGERPPERVEIAGTGVVFPAIAPVGDRLAYTYAPEDMDIYRVDPPGPTRPFSRSSAQDSLPQFSPDGRRVAFCSGRSADAFEVWVAGLDGSPAERLTHGPGDWQCSPSWSPDGTTVAFDSRAADGSWHVWTIGVAGGPPRQVTADAGSQVRPTWSPDGRWIYFVWRREHDRDVWRIRLSGEAAGAPERVTQGGAAVTAARASLDGTGIYYKREHGDGPLLFQPLAGGEARPIVACVAHVHFTVAASGIYYIPCAPDTATNHEAPVRQFDAATGEDRLFVTLDDIMWPSAGRWGGALAVSPDGRTMLYCRLHTREADLMMIEHFR